MPRPLLPLPHHLPDRNPDPIQKIGDCDSKPRAVLNLVDLSGSERLVNEENTEETAYINKSLFVLSNVIYKLANPKKKYPSPHSATTSPSGTPSSPGCWPTR